MWIVKRAMNMVATYNRRGLKAYQKFCSTINDMQIQTKLDSSSQTTKEESTKNVILSLEWFLPYKHYIICLSKQSTRSLWLQLWLWTQNIYCTVALWMYFSSKYPQAPSWDHRTFLFRFIVSKKKRTHKQYCNNFIPCPIFKMQQLYLIMSILHKSNAIDFLRWHSKYSSHFCNCYFSFCLFTQFTFCKCALFTWLNEPIY